MKNRRTIAIGATSLITLGLTLWVANRAWDYQTFHWMEAELTLVDQRDMVSGCAELIPVDVRNLRLDYRNMDTNLDIFHYESDSSLEAILQKAKAKWTVVSKNDDFACLEWNEEIEPWQHEPFAAMWWRSGNVVVCRSRIPDPGHDQWCLEKVRRHSPIPLGLR